MTSTQTRGGGAPAIDLHGIKDGRAGTCLPESYLHRRPDPH